MFSCEFYEIFKDMLFNRTPPVAASRTCVIMGDSILNDLNEEKLSKQYNFRIRKFPGATVDDLNHPVHPIFRKKPKHIIRIETNDATRSIFSKILDKLKLKAFTKGTLPETDVTFSTPTITLDNGKYMENDVTT